MTALVLGAVAMGAFVLAVLVALDVLLHGMAGVADEDMQR